MFLSAFVMSAALAAAPQPGCEVRAIPAVFAVSEVAETGLVAAYFAPEGVGRRPALLVLGGSEGGTAGVRALGRRFAEQGYAVLALSYFGAPGLPATLEEVPLEYFDHGIAWLAAQPGVDRKRIGVFGISKGGEASLLVASRSPTIRAAAAGVPSSVAWQGISTTGAQRSSWSVGGKPAPYLPYDPTVRFDFTRYLPSIYAMYEGGLTGAAEHPDAVIPVERINGPVLLISGEADALWPSSKMSNEVVARLKAKGFRYGVTHLSYPQAGHTAASPPSAPNPASPDEMVGGAAEGNRAARADMWPKLVCFFQGALSK